MSGEPCSPQKLSCPVSGPQQRVQTWDTLYGTALASPTAPLPSTCPTSKCLTCSRRITPTKPQPKHRRPPETSSSPALQSLAVCFGAPAQSLWAHSLGFFFWGGVVLIRPQATCGASLLLAPTPLGRCRPAGSAAVCPCSQWGLATQELQAGGASTSGSNSTTKDNHPPFRV